MFGVGLGSDRTGEFDPDRFGEEGDARARARLLDDGLEQLRVYWDGEFEPRPLQRPRIPVWVAARWPNRRPLRRAARWDGFFPIDVPEPEGARRARRRGRTIAGWDGRLRGGGPNPADVDPEPWAEAGASWCLTGFGAQPTRAEVEAAIG